MQKPISRRKFLKTATVAGGAALLAAGSADAASMDAATPQPYCPIRAEIAARFARLDDLSSVTRQPVFKTQLAPHWFGDNASFWYRNDLAGGIHEFIRVDAARRPGTRL